MNEMLMHFGFVLIGFEEISGFWIDRNLYERYFDKMIPLYNEWSWYKRMLADTPTYAVFPDQGVPNFVRR